MESLKSKKYTRSKIMKGSSIEISIQKRVAYDCNQKRFFFFFKEAITFPMLGCRCIGGI